MVMTLLAVLLIPVSGTAAATEGERGGEVVAFQGVVHIDREDVVSLLPPARHLVLQWACRSGQRLSRGDRIVVFDATDLQRKEESKRYEVAIAIAKLDRDNLQMTARLNELRYELATLKSERTVVRLELDKARGQDQDQIDLFRAEYDRQTQRVAEVRREVEKAQQMFTLGELAEETVFDVRHRVAKVEAEAAARHLKWRRAVEEIDTLAVAKLAMREEELVSKIGQASGDGVRDTAASGMHKRIEALERQITHTLKKNESALERAKAEHHEHVRDAYDQTPVRFVEVRSMGEDVPAVRVAFQPASMPVPESHLADYGEVMDTDRGYGWDRAMHDAMRERDVDDPLARGVALIQEEATWQVTLEDGLYDLCIGLGDTVDWHTAMVRHGGTNLFVKAKMNEPETVEATVAVTGGRLSLSFGHPWGKIIAAPRNGAVRLQPWLHTGQRFHRNNWPIAYFTDPRKHKIEALVHQDVVELLAVGTFSISKDEQRSSIEQMAEEAAMDALLGIDEASAIDLSVEGNEVANDHEESDRAETMNGSATRPAPALDRVTEVKRAMALSRVMITDAGGHWFEGDIESIGTTAVELARKPPHWYGGDEKRGKDLVARKVLIQIREDDSNRLHLGETVTCQMRFHAGDGTAMVPSHYVAEGASRFLAMSTIGEKIEVEGFRLGNAFVLTDAVRSVVDLAVPMAVKLEEVSGERTFPGEVVAGKHQDVGIAEFWGRIKDMVEDGSWVEAGQQIITLYHPELENKKEEIKDARVKAQQEYLVAMETRRLKTVDAEIQHNAKVIAERRSRVDMMEKATGDPVRLARADADLRIADAEARREAERLDKLNAMRGTSPVELRAAEIRRDRADLRRTAALVELVAAQRQVEWLTLVDARRKWLDAAEALSLRAMALQMLRKEELVSRLGAELELQRALEGGQQQRRFDRIRVIKAPVSGRIFYLTGWNDHVGSRTKITKDFVVWGGMPIAQILDMSELGMEAEIPEDLYGKIDGESPVTVGFGQYPGVRIDAVIDRVGKAFYVPRELQDTRHGEQAVNARRVFTLAVRFAPPPDIAEQLTPGTKGFIYLP